MQKLLEVLWFVLIVIMLFNAIYFSIKLSFPQLKIVKMIKEIFSKEDKKNISTMDTLVMMLGSKIGVGSIAGISFAIYYGGIGSIFWIWITTIFFAMNSFLENYFATIYKEQDGILKKGGPSYYIKNGLNKKYLSYIYGIILIITYIIGFLSIQTNTISVLTNNIFYIDKKVIGLIVVLLSAYFIFKGLKAISNISNIIIPIMSLIYIIIGILIIILNIDKMSLFFKDIISSCFSLKEGLTGFIASFYIGIKRSLFACESGIGSGAILSGATDDNNMIKQGYVGVFVTYFINFVVTTITAIIIYLIPKTNLNILNGIELSKYAFYYHLQEFGVVILLILIILFAFSTIVTGYYYGESTLKMFTKNKVAIFLLKIITLFFLYLGSVISSLTIWGLIDLFLAILGIINCYSLFKLRNKVSKV